jgi:hypothetical protein
VLQFILHQDNKLEKQHAASKIAPFPANDLKDGPTTIDGKDEVVPPTTIDGKDEAVPPSTLNGKDEAVPPTTIDGKDEAVPPTTIDGNYC